jgi:hypothetical protein
MIENDTTLGTCDECEKRFPEKLVQPYRAIHNRQTVWLCPICRLKARNKSFGYPEDTPFYAPELMQMHSLAVDYLDGQAEIKKFLVKS